MVKIFPKVYIHFFSFIFIFLCFINNKFNIFLMTYAVMLIHELAHLMAALYIGLKIDKLVLYPFGINLKLKNKFVHSLADEIILYISGPFMNCIIALLSLILYKFYRTPQLQLIYIANIMLFITNMLPVYPLDGGIIIRKILTYKFGTDTALNITKYISIAIILVLVVFCIYGVFITEFNFSVMILTAFLLFSLFTQNEKYDTDFVKNLMFYKKKSKKRIIHLIAADTDNLSTIAKKFKNDSYAIIYIENREGHIIKTMTETEVINKLILS